MFRIFFYYLLWQWLIAGVVEGAVLRMCRHHSRRTECFFYRYAKSIPKLEAILFFYILEALQHFYGPKH